MTGLTGRPLLPVLLSFVAITGSARAEGPVLEFHYDSGTGRCLNASGQAGYNTITPSQLQETKNGECGAFQRMDFSTTHIKVGADGQSFETPLEQRYVPPMQTNFRGADFSGVDLHFSGIGDANLEGANLATIDYGYASITGTIDQHTKLPASGECREVRASYVSCSR